jgi:hypothetical protein
MEKMLMFQKSVSSLLITALAMLLAAGMNGQVMGGVVIDDFHANMVPVVAPAIDYPGYGWDLSAPYINGGNPPYTNTLVYSETSVPGVLGGTRKTTVTNHDDGTVAVDLQSTGPNEHISLSTPGWYPSSYGEMHLLYDGGGGGGGLNLNMSSWPSLEVDFDPDHVGNQKSTVMSFTLYDGLNSASASTTWTTYTYPFPRTVVSFNMSDFTTNNPSLNLSSIDSILFTFETDRAGDVSFYSISGIPEPATLSLLALGGLALVRRRR